MKHLSKTMIVVWVICFLVVSPLIGQAQQRSDEQVDHAKTFKVMEGILSMNFNLADRIMHSSTAYNYLERVEKEVHFAAWYQESKGKSQKETGSTPLNPQYTRPPMSVGRFVGEFSAGIVGGIGMVYLASIFYKDDGWFPSLEGLIILLSGHVLGTALGVYVAGNTGNQRGSFGSALAGSLLGEAISIVFLVLTQGGGGSTILVVGAPLFATLVFNSSTRYKVAPVSKQAFLNFKKGRINLGMPVVQVLPEDQLAQSMGFSLSILNLEW